MCHTIVKVPHGPFHSDRFQKRVANALSDVPEELECPECHHDFDIVISGRQVNNGPVSRRLFRHFRCRVCDCRFSQMNPESRKRLVSITILSAAFVTLIVLPQWLF